jgi:adenylyltransferase/sulfurtransferase
LSGAPIHIDTNASSQDGRFSRFELIGWWEQARLRRAKVVVIGAGAIGNEVIKNLALLGVGNVFIADMDTVEESNLSRSVLFRSADRGKPKAEAAARAARDIYPDINVRAWRGNVVHDLGLGLFRWADVIIGGLDNREARVAINTFAARAGRTWIDGAIERLDGVARVFDPATGPCYECTMNENDWRELEARRSCALLTREEMAGGKVPTTPTTASVVAGIQCQEVVKYLHGLETIAGQGFVFEGRNHQSYLVGYSRNPDCAAHEPYTDVVALNRSVADTTGADLLAIARKDLGPSAVLDLGRDMISALECVPCGKSEPFYSSLGKVTESQGRCPACKAMRTPRLYSTLRGDEAFLARSLGSLGVPAWEIVAARAGDEVRSYELAGDRAAVLGPLSTEANP